MAGKTGRYGQRMERGGAYLGRSVLLELPNISVDMNPGIFSDFCKAKFQMTRVSQSPHREQQIAHIVPDLVPTHRRSHVRLLAIGGHRHDPRRPPLDRLDNARLIIRESVQRRADVGAGVVRHGYVITPRSMSSADAVR